jgi:hypothetical protein
MKNSLLGLTLALFLLIQLPSGFAQVSTSGTNPEAAVPKSKETAPQRKLRLAEVKLIKPLLER